MICPRVSIEVNRHFLSLKKEVFRKSIHICTAFVPVFLHYFRVPVLILLALAGIVYVAAEYLRLKGKTIPVISAVTAAAARKRDENKFVLGPVTLVLGVLICALLWQEPFAATGIVALAFGDGFASLAGKTFGKIEVPLTGGKTAAGSLTCFTAIYLSSYVILRNTELSLLLAFAGTIIEGLPLKDYDNLLIPVVIGGLSQFLFPHI